MGNSNNTIYNLPSATEEILRKFDPTRGCDNLGLLLDKYPPKTIYQKPSKESITGKTAWLLDVLKPKYQSDKSPNNHINAEFAARAYKRWQKMTKAFGAVPFDASLDWRMVVGMGGETILETDLTLHHLYGIPYIPGSALKGLTRAYATAEDQSVYIEGVDGKIIPSTKTETDHEEILRIFGSQEHAGTVIFFDAMPVDGKATFALDIMNSHYPNYYGEKKPPTNDQNPNPVTFLTVTNTAFMFALAPRSPKDQKDVEQTKQWLQEALQKYGVGGKTSAGYGYFQRPLELPSSKLLSSEGETLPAQKPELPQRIRPIIKRPGIGQGIQGKIIEPTEQLHQTLALEGDFLFLRYMEYDPRDIFIVIEKHELEKLNMLGRKEYYLLVSEIYENDGCIIVVGRPKPPKNKKK